MMPRRYSLSKIVKVQVDPMLEYYKPSSLKTLGFKKLELGTRPPLVTSFKAKGSKSSRGSEIILDIAYRVDFDSDIRIAMELAAPPVRLVPKVYKLTASGATSRGRPSAAALHVADPFSPYPGTLRLLLGPVKTELYYPSVEALVVSMPELPRYSFKVSYGKTLDAIKLIAGVTAARAATWHLFCAPPLIRATISSV